VSSYMGSTLLEAGACQGNKSGTLSRMSLSLSICCTALRGNLHVRYPVQHEFSMARGEDGPYQIRWDEVGNPGGHFELRTALEQI
jgi:hypothetical protein